MVVYTNKNCSKMYLSPYVDIRSFPNKLILFQTLFNAEMTILLPRSLHGEIVNFLQKGTSYYRGVFYLHKNNLSLRRSKQLFDKMIQNGMLE